MKTVTLILISLITCASLANEVETYTVSNDGKILALAFDDSIIRLYDLNNGELLHQLKSHKDSIQTLNFNSDGSRLISGDWGDYAIIWEVKTGKVIKKKNMGETVMHAIYAANDQYLVMAIDEKPLAFYDLDLENKISSYAIFDRLQTSENKKFLAGQRMYSSNFKDAAVIVVDVLNNNKIMEIPEDSYDDEIYFSKDSSIVVVRDYSDFHVWDITSKKKLGVIDTELDVDESLINQVADQLWLTGDNKVEVWDYRTQKLLCSFAINDLNVDKINDLSFSPDGKKIAISLWLESDTSSVIVLDSKDNSNRWKIEPMSKKAFALEFIDNDTLLINTSYPIEIWDTKNKKMKFLLTQTGNHANKSIQDIFRQDYIAYQYTGSINGIDSDGKGNIILTGASSSNGSISMDNKGKLAEIFQNNYSTGYDARYSHDGSLAAFAYHGEHLLLYNTDDGSLYAHLDLGGVPSGFRIIKFSADDSLLAVGSDDGSVHIVDVKSKKPIKHVEFFTDEVGSDGTFSLQWLSKNKLLVGTLENIYELDVSSGTHKKVWDTGATALHAYFENNQIKYIAVGQYDDDLIVLDKDYNKIKSTEQTGVGRLATTKDGKRIVALAAYNAFVWDLDNNTFSECEMSNRSLWGMAFDESSNEIYVGGDEGKVLKYDINCKTLK